MTVCHKDAYYLCDPTDVLIYVTTAHIVHIASPRLQGGQGALCCQLCHRGKGFKSSQSCRKNPAALGSAELDLVNCALSSRGGGRHTGCKQTATSMSQCPLCLPVLCTNEYGNTRIYDLLSAGKQTSRKVVQEAEQTSTRTMDSTLPKKALKPGFGGAHF